MSLTWFGGEPAEARGIVSKELTVGSKTIPTVFLVVNVKGRYNLLLGTTRSMLTSAYRPWHTSASCNGSETRSKWWKLTKKHV
jgi:hypothetical protein